MRLRLAELALVFGLLTTQAVVAQDRTVAPTTLVVMIEGRTPTGAAVKGAGLVVGRLSTGELLIVTAAHLTHSLDKVNELALRFFDDPDRLVAGRVLPQKFGAGLDLAVVAAGQATSLRGVDFAQQIPVGRLDEPVKIEERVALIGQTEGKKWDSTSRNQMVTGDQGNSVRVNSFEAGPGVSGGVAVDSSDRIIGIALNDDRYVITVLKLSAIATQLRAAGLPFGIAHGQTRIASTQDFAAELRATLRSSDDAALTRFAPVASTVPIMNMLLDEPETLKAFSSNLKSNVGLSWLKQLVAAGFDPNRLITLDNRRRPLLRSAMAQNNVSLAVALLDAGAWPYLYDDLWGQEYSLSFFLFPLEILSRVSATDAEKRELVKAMVRAGLTSTELVPPKGYRDSEQMQDAHATQRAVASRYGVSIPTQNALDKGAGTAMCRRASSAGYDWCRLITQLPARLVARTSGWHTQFQEAMFVKPVAVVEGFLYVMTFSVESGNAPAGYGLMRVSKDADELVWYRYMGSGFGLGHCEELRGVTNWKPDGNYRQCWRRQILNRTWSTGIYSPEGYRNVEYDSVR